MYKTNIKFTNIDSENEVRNYIEKKLVKVVKLTEVVQDETIFRIEVGKESLHHETGDVYRAEFQTLVAGNDFRVVKQKGDVYVAIDDVAHELWREIKNSRKKTQTLIRRSGRTVKDLLRKFYK